MFLWFSRVISSTLSLLCVVFTPDGSNQSFGPTLRGHGGRQLHHHGAEAAGQFGEEVLPRSSQSQSQQITEGLTTGSTSTLFYVCSDFYVTMVKWATPERLSVRWVNRAQNTSILSLCDVTTSACEKVRGRRTDRPRFSTSKTSLRVFF